MRLGVHNLIINDSDSKPSEFDCQFLSHSKSNGKLVLSINVIVFYLLLIKFKQIRSLFLTWTNFFWYSLDTINSILLQRDEIWVQIWIKNLIKTNPNPQVDLIA